MRKWPLVLTIILSVLTWAPRSAPGVTTTLTFEDLPNANLFLGGNTNIGSFYPGATFGPDVTGLSISRFGYNDQAFPPHSADTVVTSVVDPEIDLLFTQPVSSLSGFYTSFDTLTLAAYDSGGGLLGQGTGTPNTDGVFGSSDPISIAFAGFPIARVVFTGTPTNFTLDDLTFITPALSVPSPAVYRLPPWVS